MDAYETEDLVDELVALYAERVARGEDPRREELLARAPAQREELERCFRMLDGGEEPHPGALASGVQVGDFRLLRELGRGGMAVVYEAEQRSLGRRVALKVLRHHLTLAPRQRERFQREARTAAKLRHPNVAPIHAVGLDEDHAYIAFELVRGPSLAAVLATLRGLGRRPGAAELARASGADALASCASYAEACVRLLDGVFDALEHAHASGVIHRDIKPSNLLLDERGVPLVADFGLAKDMGEASLSITGETLGTPHYMSPEQAGALADRVDARTDVYSLGVTLYELLTLARPHEGDTLQQLVERITHAAPPHPHTLAPDVPRALGDVVLKALEKEPARRYANVAAFRADLERALRGAATNAAPALGLGAIFPRWQEALSAGAPFEHRSRATILGLPWLHIVSGVRDPRTRKPVWARGVLAFGDYALGVYAAGKFAVGGLALGGISIGLVGIGAIALGFNAVGGLVLGWEVTGLMAMGERGTGLLAETVAHPAERTPAIGEHAGLPQPVLVSVVAIAISLLMLHGTWRRRATTPAAVRRVDLVARLLMPALFLLPALLHWSGVELPFLIALAYVTLVSALGSLLLKRLVA